MIIRRAFLKGSMAALVALGIDPNKLFGAPQAPSQNTTTCGLAWFEARRGTSFRVKNGGAWTGVELVDVQPIDIAPELEQFHVVFRGAANAGMREGLHTVQPEDGDPAALYLSPTLGGDYMATFCRLRSSADHSYAAA